MRKILFIILAMVLLSSVISSSHIVQVTNAENSLVAYWKFDEGSGTIAYDSSGNGNNGILVNGPTWVDGKFGKALRFDGVDDYVKVPDNPTLRLTTGITLEVWVKTDGTTNDHQVIVTKWYPSIGSYTLEFQPNGITPQFVLGTPSIVATVSGVTIPFGSWVHIAGTYDGITAKIYVNGTLTRSQQVKGTITVGDQLLCIGAHSPVAPSDRNWFKGVIDDTRIYNRALSADEIKAHAQVTLRIIVVDQALVSDYRANVGSVQTIGFHAKWENGSDVVGGNIWINGTRYVTNETGWIVFNYNSSSIGKKTFTVTAVNCSGVSYYVQWAFPLIVLDRVNIELRDTRVGIGSTANITWTGFYEYDRRPFSGSVSYNDTLNKNVMGRYGYTVASVVDSLYGLTAFKSNQVYCTFDCINVQHQIETLSPSGFQVTIYPRFESDGTAVKDAKVIVNGIVAGSISEGTYRVDISSWMPFLTVRIGIERSGFEPITKEATSYALANIVFLVSLSIVASIIVVELNSRRVYGKRLKQIEELISGRGRMEIKEASEVLAIDETDVKALISQLMNEKKVQGTFTLDGKSFVTEKTLMEEVRRSME